MLASVLHLLPYKWRLRIREHRAPTSARIIAPLDGRVRLNLGSGEMNVPGYLNVDRVGRGGHVPDIVSDITKLDLPDAYADEIMAIHVVEHFWVWEVENILVEWKRVLKPGGRLVLELPDLLKAARLLIKSHGRSQDAVKTAMNGLYGDPDWMEEVMIHRWGWTPDEMEGRLLSVGFVNVRHERPQFHKIVRDMRVTARKP